MHKKKSSAKNIPLAEYENEARVTSVDIGTYNIAGMKLFGANVSLARAIPNAADGLKLVEMRCLYSMARISHADKRQQKVLALQGDVIKIHPHGDTSVSETIIGLSKSWEMTYPLVDIDSNNGTAAGNEAGAPRYLDAKLSDYCIDCFFKDWDPNVIEMKDSYNRDFKEPLYLISRYPNMLVKPSIGFAFSVATSIPSYNLGEAFQAVIDLIRNPDYEPVLIPDLPSECIIVDEGNFREISKTGRGTFKMRAEIEIDEEHSSLIVYSIPYKTKLDKIIEKIVELKSSGELSSLKKVFNASSQYQVELHLTFVQGVDLEIMRNILYKKTPLEDTFGVLMTYVDNYEIHQFTLKEIMQNWIAGRRVIKMKYHIGKIVRIRERLIVLDVLIQVISDKDLCEKMIYFIRHSQEDELIEKLNKKFNITKVQAKWFTELKTKQLNRTALEKYKEEFKELTDELKEHEEMVRKPKKIDKEIISELEQGIKKYDRPRRCRVEKYNPDTEILVSDVDYVLVFTEHGYVKKMLTTDKGAGNLMEGDVPVAAIKINNRDAIVIFDSKGMIHTLNVADIPLSQINTVGVTMSKFVGIKGTIITVIPRSKIQKDGQFIFVTNNGIVKRSMCNVFGFKSSVVSIVLKKGDELKSVLYDDSFFDMIIFTRNGFGVRFNTKSISETSRLAAGVIGIDVADGDVVAGITKIRKSDTHIVLVSTRGNGKLCSLNGFQLQKRRGEVTKVISLLPKEDLFQVIGCTLDSRFLVVTNKMTFEMGADEFPQLTRNHYGKKVIPVKRGDSLVKFERLV